MLDRLRFWARALSRGVTSLNTWAGWFALIVLVLGVAAGITVPLVFRVSHWLTAVILIATAAVVVAEGSFLEWEGADELRRKAESDLENARSDLETLRRTAVSAPTEPKPPPLELHLYGRSEITVGGVTAHFIGVTNRPGSLNAERAST